MKELGQLPYSKIAPELEHIAAYHGLRLNRVNEYKIALIIFSNLYYNAPWESEYDPGEHILLYEKKQLTNTGLYLANRHAGRYAKFLQKLKGSWLRRIFTKRAKA